MTLQEKKNHVEEALSHLILQFSGKPNLESLLTVFVDQIQHLENVFQHLLVKRRLEEAVGAQLDALGCLLDLNRDNRDDETYRQWLKARIRLNKSSGTIEDIIGLVRALVNDKRVVVTESFPAHFEVEVIDPIGVNGFHVSTIVQSAKPAGVRGIFCWQETLAPFVFEGDPDPNGKGFDQGGFAGAADF